MIFGSFFTFLLAPRVPLRSLGHGKKVIPAIRCATAESFGQKKGPRQSLPALPLRQTGITPPLPVSSPDESGQALI